MELYISTTRWTCLTCAANGDCELAGHAGAGACRRALWLWGDNQFSPFQRCCNAAWMPKDESNPYSLRPSKCIVCSRLRARLREVQGTLR